MVDDGLVADLRVGAHAGDDQGSRGTWITVSTIAIIDRSHEAL